MTSKRSKHNNVRRNKKTNNHMLVKNSVYKQIIPDELIVQLPMTTQMTNYFNASVSCAVYDVYANSINNISASLAARVPYGAGPSDNYQKYRVDKSSISITILSREATKNQVILVVPTLSSAALANISDAVPYQHLPFTKSSAVSPYVGGQPITNITNFVDISKFVGPHYKQQDEYAASVGVDPATKFYWKIIMMNPDANTLTSGGVSMFIRLTQTVTFYEPRRDLTAD